MENGRNFGHFPTTGFRPFSNNPKCFGRFPTKRFRPFSYNFFRPFSTSPFKSASLFFVTIKHHQITLVIRQNLYFLLHTRLMEKFWDFFKSASLFFVTIKHHQITLCILQNLYFLLHSRLMEKKQNANSTLCSQAVSHPSTNRAQCCLTSVIGRELVHSA